MLAMSEVNSGAATGALQFEVEHELEVRSGMGRLSSLSRLMVQCVELGEQLVERSRLVRKHDHEGGTVGAGVDLEVLRDAGEAGVVVVSVLDARGKDVEAIEARARQRRERRRVGAPGLGDPLRGDGGVLTDVDAHVRQPERNSAHWPIACS